MTPERWKRIDELFEGASRMELAERETWLRRACGDDEGLRAEVASLLCQAEGAERDGFLSPSKLASGPVDATGSWAHRGDRRPGGIGPAEHDGSEAVDEAAGFALQAAISFGTRSQPSVENRSLAQQRLRELTVLCLLMAGMTLFWKYVILGEPDLTQEIPYTIVLLTLGPIIATLSRPKLVPRSVLDVLELGIIGLVAAAFAFTQYHAMLNFSLRGDPERAQHVLNHRVHITAILILSYGIYAPKTWRRTALVAGLLAILPFVTLMAVYFRYPQVMEWLVRKGVGHGSSRLALFGLDLTVLLILAVVSAFGAHTITRLRRQVREARQLGRYHLRRRIGAGGMGEVYLAEHQLLKRPCALKLIRPDNVADPRAVVRFEREVQLTAALSHPNTVDVFDYGRTEDGTYYYVMEYLPGLSLEELAERHGPLPPGRAVYLLRQVCGALSEAHAAGLIHRDIKPSNIFASRRGGMDDVAKLLDFGLVLPVARLDMSPMSGEGRILGTPLFMSPEQAQGSGELDGRSDIYSLGAVAYYLLTGRPPFEGEDGIELMIAHARDPVVSPSLVRDDVPQDLERVVLRCLAKAPADRYPDAMSLECALGACACTADWDQARAAGWWRDADCIPATQALVL